MTPQESIERRMAALFVLALALIGWQAPKTRPLQSPAYVTTLEEGEQVFPVAVPPDPPLVLPEEPVARRALLAEHAVQGFEPIPEGSCEAFVRVSGHHWLRVPASPGPPPAARLDGLGLGLLALGETEVFCHR